MLTLENDNKLMELRKELTREEMTTKTVANEVKSIDTKRVNELIGNYHNNGYNKLNNYSSVNVINTNDRTIHSNNINVYRKENSIDLKDIKRGEILYVDIDQKGIGSEQAGIRYSVCLQNDIGNKFSPTVIVAFITSRLTKSRIPTHVEIAGGNFGLPKDSVVLLEQVRTLDKRRIIKRVGKVDELTLKKIDKALAISMGDLQQKNTLERLDIEMQKYIISNFKMINTYEITIETMKINNVPENAIDLIENQKFREENGLRCYCDDNRLNYDILYYDYKNMIREKDEDIAL